MVPFSTLGCCCNCCGRRRRRRVLVDDGGAITYRIVYVVIFRHEIKTPVWNGTILKLLLCCNCCRRRSRRRPCYRVVGGGGAGGAVITYRIIYVRIFCHEIKAPVLNGTILNNILDCWVSKMSN